MGSSNLIVAHAYLDHLWSRRNLYFIELLVAEDSRLIDPLFGEGTGQDHVRAQVGEMHQGFPDLAYNLDDVMANRGDQIAVRWSARGTHLGSLIGIPATARAMTISGLLLLRLANNRLISITSMWEPFHMLQQLGLVPGTDQVAPPVRSAEVRVHAPSAAFAPTHVDAELLQGAQECVTAASAPGVDIDAQWDM